MNKEQIKAALGEAQAGFSRMEEMLEAVKARRGPRYAHAINFAVNVTAALAHTDGIARSADANLAKCISLVLDCVGPDMLEVCVCLAYAERNPDPKNHGTFIPLVREFTAEIKPLIDETQRLHNRTATTLGL